MIQANVAEEKYEYESLMTIYPKGIMIYFFLANSVVIHGNQKWTTMFNHIVVDHPQSY